MHHDDEPKRSDRRRFLIKASQAAAAAAGATFLPIQKALAVPAKRVTGTIQDVQHVVILMQENRAFDHYFGTLSGVRGFGDRGAIPLPSGKSVWFQSDGAGEILPFHLDTKTTTAMRVPGTPHTWPDAQLAWDQGRLYQWPRYKNFPSMGYYLEADIPFQRALAEAFTVCDAHHCSIQTGTLPNRVVFMTGTNATPGIDEPATSQTQALIDNSNNLGRNLGLYTWTTYPERLQAAGVSWRIYQDPVDNWGALLAPWESFAQYQSAVAGDPLYENAMRKWTLDDLREQVLNETLPQVSWVVPHRNWSEHPSASSPLQGASFTQQVLDALTANPEVWSKTVLIITFDENDGLFDHAPPPAVPSYDPDGTLAGKTTLETPIEGEYYTNTIDGVSATRPYGMGPRVPMYIVSPWSRGGWVDSQVFDHTSTIRFLEARFGVAEPNITPWHRAVSGDLTSAFDFAHPNDEELPELPDMSYATIDTLVIEGLPPVSVPAEQSVPVQDQGLRYSRALPYVLHAHVSCSPRSGRVSVRFDNQGRQGAVFHVYDRLHLDRFPRRYTVEAGKSLSDGWDTAGDAGLYDLWILGPNGFQRHFIGSTAHEQHAAPPALELHYEPARVAIELVARNTCGRRAELQLTDAYDPRACLELELPRDGRIKERLPLRASARWYDVTIRSSSFPGWSNRFAGRLENGRHGFSDPLLGH
jgi:phospholipase C